MSEPEPREPERREPEQSEPEQYDQAEQSSVPTEAPHESETLEEPVLNADGEVVPVPEHDDNAFVATEPEVYGHQTHFGTENRSDD